MKLNVPLLKQKNKLACGPTCLRMILFYYGKDFSEKDILKEIKLKRFGSYTTDLAYFAAEVGFRVECYSYNLKIFSINLASSYKKQLLKELEKLQRKVKVSFDKGVIKSIIKAIKGGVTYKFIRPNFYLIDKYLQKKIPVIISVNWASLKNKPGDVKMGHSIVITGKLGKNYFYNDPCDGKEYKIESNHLFFAISNNVLDSSAYLLAIKQ